MVTRALGMGAEEEAGEVLEPEAEGRELASAGRKVIAERGDVEFGRVVAERCCGASVVVGEPRGDVSLAGEGAIAVAVEEAGAKVELEARAAVLKTNPLDDGPAIVAGLKAKPAELIPPNPDGIDGIPELALSKGG